jgi:hypothetical protein
MKSRSIIVALILALLCASIVNAATTVTSPTIGGDNQVRGLNAQTTFTVQDATFVGTKTVTVSVTSNSGYNLLFDDNSTSKDIQIVNGTAVSVIIKGLVPLNHDAVNSNLAETAFQVGTLSADGATAEVKMQAENNLKLDKIKVIIDGKSKTVDDGDEIEDINVGDDLSIEITAENTGDEDENDNDMRDVEITALVDDSDFDVDEEEEIDVDAGDSETVTFDGLSVSDDVEDDTFELEVTVDGTDDNGARHGEKASIDLTVERNSHDIAVRTASLTSGTISCENPSTSVSAYLVNIGTKDEENVAVRVENAALGVNTYVSGISLDESDSMSKTLSISPKTDKPGTYTLDVIGYWNGGTESSRKQVTLTVAACPTSTTPSGSGSTGTTVVVTPTPVTPTPVVTPQPTTPQPVNVPIGKVTSATSKTDWTIPLLIVGIVIVLILLGLLVAVLVRGRGSA